MKLLSSLRPETRIGRPVALTSVFALLIATVPGPAIAAAVKPVERFVASLDERIEPMPKSRLLTAAVMDKAQGRTGENPYLAGQSKWDISYKGVNLMTGNYSASGTDLTFEGGYGIPVNVTRSYSANNADEGPLGKGWTLSVDVRSTAGGLVKSGSAPVRAVPTALKERPSAQIDANAVLAEGTAAQPVEAVIATDAGGTEETIQVDADGVLTTPPWDKNTNETEYENIVQTDGSILRRTVSNKTFTPDGTVYVYQRKGTYPNGTRPWDDPSAASEHSDVMKIVSATDRQGNVTTYTYGDDVSFQKANGLVVEERLTKIHMPNGHEITFTWADVCSDPNVVRWRITEASDGIPLPNGRRVTYAYSQDGLLTSVTTPGGKTTAYGWTSGFISSITDPRGLSTTILTENLTHALAPYGATNTTSPVVTKITAPNGVQTVFTYPVKTPYSTPAAGGSFYEGTDGVFENRWVWGAVGIAPDGAGGVTVGSYQQDGDPDMGAYATRFYWYKTYDIASQNLMQSRTDTHVPGFGGMVGYNPHAMYPDSAEFQQHVYVDTAYNFMGNPLSQTTTEKNWDAFGTPTTTRVASTEYAYWGANKYWQQKMVRDEGASFGTDDRISYKDYYTATDAAGSRGQTKKIYDAKNTDFVIDPNITLPDGVSPSAPNVWKYQLVPQSDTHAALFEYDAKGRPVDVWKLQSTATTPWTYVQTHTVYGTDTDGSWGRAASVVEDYNGIGRTTATLEYDSMGRAVKVQDAKGQTFETHYDLDGAVESVDRIVGGVATPVVTYTYGTSGLTNGQVLSVKDELSGVEQTFGYCPSGGGLGQVSGVVESGGPNPSYSTGYTYNAAGDRATATYTTPEGTTQYAYEDYIPLGDPTQGKRGFQTMKRLGSSPELFHYAYTSDGRLRDAAFAQTVASGAVTKRARASYRMDPSGRLLSVAHTWETLSGNSVTSSTPILANACDYETSGPGRGLKTASRFYRGVSGAWNLERTETYSYDAANDQLTDANYGDGGANQIQSWGYDAAGNRISDSTQSGSWSYDHLNRILASPAGSYTHDVLGKRLTGPGSVSHSWDALGRMTSLDKGSATTEYNYRADGMRVAKAGASTGEIYRYDGQMPIETVEMTGTAVSAVERHGVGSRGTDLIERTTSSGTQLRFPLYDAHGNSIGTLGRSGSSWSVGDERSYDAWGRVRQGGQMGAPSARYCASIGHVQDDESGLVYMRARYYEPETGRFISTDPKHQGSNWFIYCGADPVNKIDFDGCIFIDFLLAGLEGIVADAQDAKASAAAGNYAKKKVGDIAARKMGELCGMIAMLEFEAGAEGWLFATNDGFGSKYGGKGNTVHMHFADHGDGFHVDFRGKLAEVLRKYNFGSKAIPLQPFLEGFLDGFFGT